MANSSNSGGPKDYGQRFWLLFLSRPVIGLLLLLVAALAGIGWRAWIFVQEELAPLVEKNLSQTLDRPVKLGRVERFSLTGLRFGPSSVPPFNQRVGNTIVKDPDQLSVPAVDVVFDPLDLLLDRTLNLDVTLDQPGLYLEQAKDGRWISTVISPREEEGLIETRLQAIRFRNAKAVLLPLGAAPRTLQSVDGSLLFVNQSQQIKFDVAGRVSDGKLKVEGQWLRPTQQVNLSATGENLLATELAGLVKLPFDVKAGRIGGNLKVELRQNRLVGLEGIAQIQAASVVVPDQYLLRSSRPTPRSFQGVKGTVQFLDRANRLRFNLAGRAAGGDLRVKGQWLRPNQQANLLLQAQNLPAKFLDGAFKLPIRTRSGRVDGNLRIQLRQNQLPSLNGTARLTGVTAQIAQVPRPLTGIAGQLRFKGLTTTLENVRARYGKIPIRATGSVDPKQGYNLSAQMAQVEVAQALSSFSINLPFPTAGIVQGQDLRLTGPLTQPLLSGEVTTLGTARVDRVDFRQIRGRFQLKAPVLRVSGIQGIPVAGGMVTGNAQLDLRAGNRLLMNLQAQGVPGNAIARAYTAAPVTLGLVSAQAQISGPARNLSTAVRWQVPQATYPGTGEILVSGGRTLLQNINLQVAGGQVKVDGRIADGQLQATLESAGVQLQRFSPTLRGGFSGRLNLSGVVANFRPAAIRAAGQVRFSQGLSVVQQPITAQVRWDGQKIRVDRATATGFRASGSVFARLQGPQAPQVSALNLDVQAQGYPLQTLLQGVSGLKLSGQGDFSGRLTGTPTAPSLRGTLQTQNLVLNQVAFERTLTGSLNYGRRGLALQLGGAQDQINLALGPSLRPRSFYIQREQAVVVGRTQGEQLRVNLERFPLAALNLAPSGRSIGPVAGLVSGNFDVNLRTFTGQGNVAIARPQIGSFVGDQFTGQLRFAQGVATLSNGELRQANSRVALAGTFAPGANPRFSAQVKVAQAEVQDALAALQWFNLADVSRGLRSPSYGKAADVQTVEVGAPEAPLETQLRRLSEVERLLAQQVARRQAASPLPDLADLQGTFGGQIEVSGSQRSGLALDFNLQGENFDWGPYSINQLIANGSYQNGVLELQPLRLQSGDSLVAFAGQVGGAQSGQLRVENVPADRLREFVDLPVDFTGAINATATIAGSLSNPQVVGDLSLNQATLNGTPVRTAQGNFSYRNARLDFGSTVVVSAPEPIQISGSIPYLLPFAAVEPTSNRISLDLNVQNEGLALLNVFTRQVAWVNGAGQVNLQVRGTLDQPLVNGIATVTNATLRAQALPAPLTNVAGTLRFNRDRIRVERLTGQFSDGQVAAAGVIPISSELPATDPDQVTPLTVRLNRLALQLKELYTGGVDGNVTVTGAALSPKLGGAIQLSEGQVLLGAAPGSVQAPPGTSANLPGTPEDSLGVSPVEFDNLRVTLGDRVQVTRAPLLNFLAAGDLTLNGSVGNLRPQGLVRFQRGQVNLFTTQFRVDRGESNYAQFKPDQGLDPDLNVNLVTTVTEVTGSRINSLSNSQGSQDSSLSGRGDVPVGTLGSLESVRIQARVRGRASQLTRDFENNVELTSSPARNQDEIIALIGGGLGNAQNEGDSTLALANLAGSAFFSNFQGLFDNLLGNRVDFRLFPTVLPSQSGNSALNLGAEVGYDVTRKISLSALQVLTDPGEPTQLNARYQFTDNVNLRSSINLEGDIGALVEYRLRF